MSRSAAAAADTDRDVVAFGATVGLRLAATLNLRRTLGQVLALAVPRIADLAVLSLEAGTGVRGGSLRSGGAERVWSAPGMGAAGEAPADGVEGLLRSHGVDDADLDWLTVGGFPEGRRPSVPDVEVLPLRARGRPLGELLLARRAETAPFDATTLALGRELASRAALALDAALVYAERTTLATTLRDALRPQPLPEVAGVRLGARYRAAEEATEIGGDFYDVYRGPQGQWWFAIGDVCGKGVEAAVLTGKVRSALRMAALAAGEPDVVLGLLNEVMLLEGGTNFVTLIVGRLGPVAGGSEQSDRGPELVLAGGGHLEPLVLHPDGTVERVATGGVLVGMLPEAAFRRTVLRLGPEDVVVLYTDGVVEADAPAGRFFGQERLERLLADCCGMPPQAIAERIEQNVLEHLAGRPHDDIAVLALGAERGPA